VSEQSSHEFARAAAEHAGSGIFKEFWYFLRHNKRWWLVPIIVVMLVFSLFILLSSTAAAPFIYTLF